jgi:hypothetical protein
MNNVKETEHLTPSVPLSAYEHLRRAVVTLAEKGRSTLLWFGVAPSGTL